MNNCDVATDLLALRRTLAWEGYDLGEFFHASTDQQAVRDKVFEVIRKRDFTIQATIMEKSKARAQVKESKPRFYQYGYFFHFKYGVSPNLGSDSEALVTTASLGTRRERIAFEASVSDVMNQSVCMPVPVAKHRTSV